MLTRVLWLPAARRELLVMAKAPVLYQTRIGSSIGLLAVGIGFGVAYHKSGLPTVGSMVQTLTFVLLTICTFMGVQLTADSLAREKREGTMGLLFLTHLTAFEIVLGKLIAFGLSGLYWILITVPLLSLLLIVGALQGAQLLALAAGGFNTLFFSCAIGLFISAGHTDRKKAATRGTWLVLFFWWGLPWLGQAAAYYNFPPWISSILALFSTAGLFVSPFGGPGMRMAAPPWLNFICIHLLGWVFVVWAAWSLRRHWQDHPKKSTFVLREWWRNISLGSPAWRLKLRRKLLDRNAFFWLASRERLRPLGIWVATIIIVTFVLYVLPFFAMNAGMIAVLAISLCVFHKAMMASCAAHALQAEQEQGTLEMIISTPLSADSIIRGQLSACFRQFAGPAGFLLLTHLAVATLLTFLPSWVRQGGGSPMQSVGAVWAGALLNSALYLLDLYGMAWAGMWAAVNVRDPRNVTGFALMRILIVPAVLTAWTVTAFAIAKWYFRFGLSFPLSAMLFAWFAFSVINNIFWVRHIRKHLPEGIRMLALRRFNPDAGFSLMGRIGRMLGRIWGRMGSVGSKPGGPVRSLPGAA